MAVAVLLCQHLAVIGLLALEAALARQAGREMQDEMETATPCQQDLYNVLSDPVT